MAAPTDEACTRSTDFRQHQPALRGTLVQAAQARNGLDDEFEKHPTGGNPEVGQKVTVLYFSLSGL